VCPTDAIVGASKRMHTVLVDECTGCELCVARCPVDCIVMEPAPVASIVPERSAHWRRRHDDRKARLARLEAERRERLAARTDVALAERPVDDPIAAALARAQAKRMGKP
jgi:electron transport complex protein RnfB